MFSNLNAIPMSVLKLLSSEMFLMPEYQRPYSLEIAHCESLWDNVVQSFQSGSIDYFLGSIVLVKSNQDTLEVVDGQQRLITLSILLKALSFHDRNSNFTATLYKIDPRENPPTNFPLRITTKVLDENEEYFLNIALAKTAPQQKDEKFDKSRYGENQNYFEDKIWERFFSPIPVLLLKFFGPTGTPSLISCCRRI